MVALLTCKNEEDPIKNRGARVFTTLYINFSDTQGQITLELVAVSGRNLNSSKLSCMSSLPARMRMIDSKMKELGRKIKICLFGIADRLTCCFFWPVLELFFFYSVCLAFQFVTF